MAKTHFPRSGGQEWVDSFYRPNNPVGNVYYVNSSTGSATGPGYSPETAYSSINAASAACTANNDDVILVMPGHVETITAANGLDLAVAGVKVIGLGSGSARPQISVGGVVGACVRINANGIYIENVVITGDLDNITSVVNINGKTDVTLKNVEYRDVTGQCAIFLSASNNSDRLTIDGLRYIGDTANAGTTKALALDGTDDLVIRNSQIDVNASTAAINFITTAANRVTIRDCFIHNWNSADVCILDTITGSTGTMGPNLFLSLTDNAANITEAITGATFRVFDNVYVCNLDGEKAMLINWTASTDA